MLVQWARSEPDDWEAIEPQSWRSLPNKPVPTGTSRPNRARGWVNALNCQGLIFAGYDHYHVEPAGEGVRIVAWNDDPDDYPTEADRWAEDWTFLPLAPDPAFGGALNTRQSCTVYTGANARAYFEGSDRTLRPWSEFRPPSGARHGIWLSDDLFVGHLTSQSVHGWREWADG